MTSKWCTLRQQSKYTNIYTSKWWYWWYSRYRKGWL